MEAITITRIESLVRAGKHRQAIREMNLVIKEGLTPMSRFHLSDWYLRIGKPYRALKILGSRLDKSQLNHRDHLLLQMRMAYMLNFFDAKKMADKIMTEILTVASSHRESRDLHKTYLRYQAEFYLRRYDYEKALSLLTELQALLDSPIDHYGSLLNTINIADGIDALGRFEEAFVLISKTIEKLAGEKTVLYPIALQARGEYLFRQGEFVKASRDFERARKLFPALARSRDYAFLMKWSGAAEIHFNRKSKAKRFLQKAESILISDRLRPMSILEVLYWKTKLKSTLLKDIKHRVIATHPCSSPFGFLCGRPFDGSVVPVWIKAQIPSEVPKYDCWTYSAGQIKTLNYLRLKERDYLDLFSGIQVRAGKVTNVLSGRKALALTLLLASGNLGINEWALVDKLYPESDYIPESMLERLHELIKVLRREGFQIVRRSNQYFWQPKEKTMIIFPCDLSHRGLLADVRRRGKSFTRRDLEIWYSVSPATAKLWIKEWQHSQRIKATGSTWGKMYTFAEFARG